MKRGKPLRRKTWMKQRRTTPRRSGRVLDPEYRRLVRKLPCVVRSLVLHSIGSDEAPMVPTKCTGKVEADHAGLRPVSRKADDDTCIPACNRHHFERTNFIGTFKGWSHDRMRTWLDAAITSTRHEILLMRLRLTPQPTGCHHG